MRRIYKYEIPIKDSFALELPQGARILHINTQRDAPCLWAEIDDTAPKTTRWFEVYGTGHLMHDNPNAYIGTFFVHDGQFVFHVYERQC